MSAWIANALAVAIVTMSPITVVSAGPCAPGSTHNCFNIPATINFSSVPEISKQVVSEEKTGQKLKQLKQHRSKDRALQVAKSGGIHIRAASSRNSRVSAPKGQAPPR